MTRVEKMRRMSEATRGRHDEVHVYASRPPLAERIGSWLTTNETAVAFGLDTTHFGIRLYSLPRSNLSAACRCRWRYRDEVHYGHSDVLADYMGEYRFRAFVAGVASHAFISVVSD